MFAVVAVAAWRHVALFRLRADRVRGRALLRIFLAVLLQELLPHGLRERVDGVSRLRLPRLLRNRDAVFDGQHAFIADEPEAVIFARSIDEVHPQARD